MKVWNTKATDLTGIEGKLNEVDGCFKSAQATLKALT